MEHHALPIRQCLIELGHPQLATPLKTDNNTAEGILNGTIKQKRSKAIDMQYYWLKDRAQQGQFNIFWQPGKHNLADYPTKHHPGNHHKKSGWDPHDHRQWTVALSEPGPAFRPEPSLLILEGLAAPGDPTLLTAAVTALTDHQLKSRLTRVTQWWGRSGGYYTPSKEEEAINLPPMYTVWAKKRKNEKTHMIFQSQQFQNCNFHGTNVPLNWTEVTTQLESYFAVLATMLGATHRVVESYQHRLLRLKKQQMPLRRAIADELGELITPEIAKHSESPSTAPPPPSRLWQWDIEVLNGPEPKLAAQCVQSSLNNGLSNNHGSNNGHTAGSTQTRLENPNRHSHVQDKSHSIVKNVDTWKMAKAIQQSMSNKGKGPLHQSDGQKRCHSWRIKGTSSFSGCKHICLCD
eukprot:jgi/Psemu1/15436/gm1.15436_g